MSALPRSRGFADVGYEEAMRRAREMIPFLRQHAEAGERARRMLPEIEAELHRTGLLRYLQPKRWGGMELDFACYFDLPELIGRGDASTAWNVANLSVHHWMLALYEPKAQEEVWGDNPDALIASGIAYPQGSARKVDGGIELTGHWNFSSSVDSCGWNMLACIVRDGERVLDHRMCLLRRSEYEIIDDWHTLGMCGTGSKSVKCSKVFVPDYRALSMYTARGGDTFPGARANPNPMYRIPLGALGAHCLAGAVVGNAQAALDASIDNVKARSTNYTGAKMRDFQTVQLRIGAAGARIDTARLLLHRDCIDAQAIAASGVVPDFETKLRFKRNCSLAVRLATEAVDMLHEMAGANGIYDQYPLSRMFRDARSAAGHISFNWDAQMTSWGLVALGGEFVSLTL